MDIFRDTATSLTPISVTTFRAAIAGPGASNTTIPWFWWVALTASAVALVAAYVFYRKMLAAPEGNEKMIAIAGYVREGARAYLFGQYKTVSAVFLIIFVVLLALAYFDLQNPFVPVAFLTAGFCSALCGFLGMKTATRASSRTAHSATVSLNSALQLAFRSGAVMGLVVVGFGLLNITVWYLLLDKFIYTSEHMRDGLEFLGLTLVRRGMDPTLKLGEITSAMVTFAMGASLQALFARVGGGIYSKAADVGADLVGKVEVTIPEDDPRNPATIADNVGDNVSDVAGMGADLFESYCGSILATAALGAALPPSVLPGGMDHVKATLAPTVVAGVGIILSVVGILLVRCKENMTQKNLLRALLAGTLSSSVLMVVSVALLAGLGWLSWGVSGAITAGLVAGVLIGQCTEYYTSSSYAPTRRIAEQANMGSVTTVLSGFATGMYSTAAPVIIIVLCVIGAFGFAGGFSQISLGIYGVGSAAVGMLATLGITLATDAYGPIADNAGGNAEMAGLGREVRRRIDALDSLGNTTAATGKGFAIGSAALTAMVLLAAFFEAIRVWIGRLAAQSPDGLFTVGKLVFFNPETTKSIEGAVNVQTAGVSDLVAAYDLTAINPKLVCGLFLGGMTAVLFCAMIIQAVSRAARDMVEEVRRQFAELPGVINGTAKPDYARCVSISTRSAQKEVIIPSLVAVIAPILTGLVLGVAGVVGLLLGSLTCGFVVAVILNNSGGAWDNAKKYIEQEVPG
ncbi:MAG: sodium-translocating pyrophosphatase, partial [Phycisphaerales bacterium]